MGLGALRDRCEAIRSRTTQADDSASRDEAREARRPRLIFQSASDLELLVGHDPLQPAVLALEVLEPLDVVGRQAAELVPRPVIGLLRHLPAPSRIGDLGAFTEEPVGLAELADRRVCRR